MFSSSWIEPCPSFSSQVNLFLQAFFNHPIQTKASPCLNPDLNSNLKPQAKLPSSLYLTYPFTSWNFSFLKGLGKQVKRRERLIRNRKYVCWMVLWYPGWLWYPGYLWGSIQVLMFLSQEKISHLSTAFYFHCHYPSPRCQSLFNS